MFLILTEVRLRSHFSHGCDGLNGSGEPAWTAEAAESAATETGDAAAAVDDEGTPSTPARWRRMKAATSDDSQNEACSRCGSADAGKLASPSGQ